MSEINLDQVKALVEHGFLDREVAEFFGVSASTYARWKDLNTKFRDLTMAWKEAADARVERSLWERATGYAHPEEKVFLGPGGVPVYADTVKHYPPDPVAMIFWLKNRHPDTWSDRHNLDITDYRIVKQVLDALPEEIRDQVETNLRDKLVAQATPVKQLPGPTQETTETIQ